MRIRVLLSALAVSVAISAPVHADVIYSCSQAQAYTTPLASTRAVDVRGWTPEQQSAHFQQLLDYYCSPNGYRHDIASQVEAARRTLKNRLRRGGKRLALVLDIDETSLNNDASILGADLRFPQPDKEQSCTQDLSQGCGYDAWEHEGKSDAIEPTHQLFREARAGRVSVFFITGRYEETAPQTGRHKSMRQITADNLDSKGYGERTCLFLQPKNNVEQVDRKRPLCAAIARSLDQQYDNVGLFKLAVRQAIMAHGYTIILNVGDQPSDLGPTPGVNDGTSEASFLLPNPFY